MLVQVDLVRLEEIKRQLATFRASAAVKPVGQMFDYLVVDIPPELAAKIAAIEGVITVVPDKWLSIKQTIPIDKKIAEFQRLFFSNPITGPPSALAYSIKVDAEKTRIPTSESRKMVGADVAEAEGIQGKGIKVAVIDTGTSYDFLFQGPFNEGSKSSIEGQPIPYDEVGHGVHVQSTISGRPFQSARGLLKGVAVDAEVAAFKALGGGIGIGMTSWILRAIADTVEWGADIVNLSLGGDDEDYTTSPYHRIIGGLTKQGMLFIIAGGNSGPSPNTIGSPGSVPDALTVGAVDINGNLAPFSSRGPTMNGLVKPDVVAPGVDILSTSAGYIAVMQVADGPPSLASISGTSMATPHVAGLCALALQYARMKGKNLTTENIKEAMNLYGEFAGRKNNNVGYGLLTYSSLRRYIDERL